MTITDSPELPSQELEVTRDSPSDANDATSLRRIVDLEETVRMLEAAADPERQSFKNDLLREELNTASERNRELQFDVKALSTQQAKLTLKIGDLETKLDDLEQTNAALLKDLDHEREDSRANRTNSEVYVRALQEVTAICTIAISRNGSEAGSPTVCRDQNNPSLNPPQLISSTHGPRTSTLQPANSKRLKTSLSPVKPPVTPTFGSTFGSGTKSLFFDPKKPLLGFGASSPSVNKFLFPRCSKQPFFSLPPINASTQSSMSASKGQPDLKRKLEETEGGEGNEIQEDADATNVDNDGQSKKARIATDEENSDSDSGNSGFGGTDDM